MRYFVAFILAGAIGATVYVERLALLQEGCEKAIFRDLTDQYGQPPAELKAKVKENISDVCRQLLN